MSLQPEPISDTPAHGFNWVAYAGLVCGITSLITMWPKVSLTSICLSATGMLLSVVGVLLVKKLGTGKFPAILGIVASSMVVAIVVVMMVVFGVITLFSH